MQLHTERSAIQSAGRGGPGLHLRQAEGRQPAPRRGRRDRGHRRPDGHRGEPRPSPASRSWATCRSSASCSASPRIRKTGVTSLSWSRPGSPTTAPRISSRIARTVRAPRRERARRRPGSFVLSPPGRGSARAPEVLHRGRIARQGARGPGRGASRRPAGHRRVGGPRPRPPDAGLRPRRAHEDRAGPGRVAVRRPRRRDPRLARGDADPQPRLGQLGRRDGARGRRAGRAPPPPGHPARGRATPTWSGVLKYDRVDARDILERASARETTARVAAGALARRLLDEFGVEIGSHVVSLGGIAATPPAELPVPLNERRRPLRGARARSRGRGRDHRAASTPPRRRATPSAARSRWWRAAWWSGSAAT